MKRNKYIGLMMMAAGLLAATSCSDFSDYNEAYVDANASADKTLWDNITSNPQLTKFANLVKKAGFDDELQSSRFYTVWAPLDDQFDDSKYTAEDSSVVLEKFIKNHIAEYNYSASGNIDERVHALNKKSFDFTGAGQYTYDGIAVQQANIPSVNGIIHTINGMAEYYPNLYDYMPQGSGIDSLSNYFKKYEIEYLDKENSVVGPIVDGKQTYIDSVVVMYNTMSRTLNAELDNEDSSYTFIMPTNETWVKQYNKVRPYYNYIAKTMYQDLLTAQGTTFSNKTVTIDNAYMRDSITKMMIVKDLIFSNNDAYSQWVEDSNAPKTDTIRTTRRTKLSNANDILAQTIENGKVKMSNGYARVVDSIASYSWETYAPTLDLSPISNVGRVLTGTAHNMYVTYPNPDKGDFSKNGLSYLWVEPTTNNAKPELDIMLPNVLATTYNFYCVFVPRSANLENGNVPTNPNQVNFVLNYCNARGALADYKFSSDMKENPSKAVPFENDTSKVDTMFLGKFTFPVAYSGLGDCKPNIKITTPFSQFNQAMLAKYTRDLRIAAIILKPVEQDEFEATKE